MKVWLLPPRQSFFASAQYPSSFRVRASSLRPSALVHLLQEHGFDGGCFDFSDSHESHRLKRVANFGQGRQLRTSDFPNPALRA
jgi:hypothetical protein